MSVHCNDVCMCLCIIFAYMVWHSLCSDRHALGIGVCQLYSNVCIYGVKLYVPLPLPSPIPPPPSFSAPLLISLSPFNDFCALSFLSLFRMCAYRYTAVIRSPSLWLLPSSLPPPPPSSIIAVPAYWHTIATFCHHHFTTIAICCCHFGTTSLPPILPCCRRPAVTTISATAVAITASITITIHVPTTPSPHRHHHHLPLFLSLPPMMYGSCAANISSISSTAVAALRLPLGFHHTIITSIAVHRFAVATTITVG